MLKNFVQKEGEPEIPERKKKKKLATFVLNISEGQGRICRGGSFCKALKCPTHHALTGPDVSSRNGSQETHYKKQILSHAEMIYGEK